MKLSTCDLKLILHEGEECMMEGFHCFGHEVGLSLLISDVVTRGSINSATFFSLGWFRLNLSLCQNFRG